MLEHVKTVTIKPASTDTMGIEINHRIQDMVPSRRNPVESQTMPDSRTYTVKRNFKTCRAFKTAYQLHVSS